MEGERSLWVQFSLSFCFVSVLSRSSLASHNRDFIFLKVIIVPQNYIYEYFMLFLQTAEENSDPRVTEHGFQE